MRKQQLSWVGAALVGGAVIHLAFVACGGSGRGGDGGVGGRADAQTTPATCSQWEVQSFAPPEFAAQTVTATGTSSTFSTYTFSAFSVPANWEPIATTGFPTAIVARHCVAP